MPRVSNIEMLKHNDQPVLSIRVHTNVNKLPQLIGECFGKMGAYLQELGERLSDVPFVAYHNQDMENLDVEIGFPVAKSLPDKCDIKSGFIAGGNIIFCMYRGAYSGVEQTYNEMQQWMKEKGVASTGVSYEFYYNDLSFSEEELLTKIMMILK